MTLKTRHILIGVLSTLSIIGLIVVLSLNWNAKGPYTSRIPIYPNSSNRVRSIKYELPPHVFTLSTLLNQTTTFQTSDTMNEILEYYQTTYQREYKCDAPEAYNTATDVTFRCTKSSRNSNTVYYVEIAISSSSSSVSTVSVLEVHEIQSKEDR